MMTNDALRDHDEFVDALHTLFDADVANGGTNPVSNREQIIDRLFAVFQAGNRSETASTCSR